MTVSYNDGIRHQYAEYNGDHSSGLVFRVPVAFGFIDNVFKENLTIIQELNNPQKKVEVYPNPTSDLIYFKPEDPEELVSITLKTNQGKTIKTFNTKQNPLDVSELSVGTYHLLFVYESTITSVTFVKM